MKHIIHISLFVFLVLSGCTSKIEFDVVPPIPPVVTTELLLSELSTGINTDPLAGGTRTHYVEIFNGTANSVDLSNYAIGYMAVSDTTSLLPWSFPTTNFFVLPSFTLRKDTCYVIASPQADRAVIKRDTSWGTTSTSSAQASTPLQLSGNSAIALLKKDPAGTFNLNGIQYRIVDVFGSPLVARNTSQGSSSSRNNFVWFTAGVRDTRNRTFFRKKAVLSPTTDWELSRGTTAENSQWILTEDRVWDYTNLGRPSSR